jgi:hypothetical protein
MREPSPIFIFWRRLYGASYVSYLCVGGSRSYWMIPGTQFED